MIKSCKVYKCRYPITHTTVYHQCGTCKGYGHGMGECGNINRINNLKQYYNDILPESQHCLFGGCINPSTHTTDSHTCEQCHERLHSKSTCSSNNKQVNIKIHQERKMVYRIN